MALEYNDSLQSISAHIFQKQTQTLSHLFKKIVEKSKVFSLTPSLLLLVVLSQFNQSTQFLAQEVLHYS